MAQRKREKEFNANADASGDFLRHQVDVNDAGNFHYADGYYYGAGGDQIQQNYYGRDGKIHARMDDRRRQGSDSRRISRRHGHQTSSSGRRTPVRRRSTSAPCNEGLVQAGSLCMLLVENFIHRK